MANRTDPGGELGILARATYHVLHFIARVLALGYFRAYAHNNQTLPRNGAVIVAPIHRSNLDVPLLGATCPRRLRYLAKGSLFRTRFWGWFFTVVGGFPLAREAKADRGALRAALRVLERGEALVVFPEGERKHGPAVFPMANGAVWLSAKSGVAILPVGIGGTERALPRGANVPKPTKAVLLYGDLVSPPEGIDGKRVSRSQMTAASSDLRATLQDLFDRAQELAGTPNAVQPS